MKPLAPDGENDIGTAWDMPRVTKAHPVRPKLMLACSYKNASGTTDKNCFRFTVRYVVCLLVG